MTYRIGDIIKFPNSVERPIIGVTSKTDDGRYAIYVSAGAAGVSRAIVYPNGYVSSPRFEGRVHWWEDFRKSLCVESISHPNT